MGKKGQILITVFIVFFLIAALIASLFFLIAQYKRLSDRYYGGLAALSLAEGGVEAAIWELNFGDADFTVAEGWSGTNPKTKTIADLQDATGEVLGNIDIAVYDPATDYPRVVSTGATSLIPGALPISRTTQVYLGPHPLFKYAVLSEGQITVTGNATIDSYDSSLGPYGGTNVDSNGNIVTNSTAEDCISIQGSAILYGDAKTGSEGTIEQIGTSVITGAQSDDADVHIPEIEIPSYLTVLPSGGGISLAGHNSLTLPTGDYKFDNIALSGHAALTLDGSTNIYLTQSPSIYIEAQSQLIVGGTSNIYFDGDLYVAGNGIANTSTSPANLSLYGTSASQITFAGSSDFYGTVYAPSSNFDITGNNDLYGAIVADTVTTSGHDGHIHFDEQLPTTCRTEGFDPTAWQEK